MCEKEIIKELESLSPSETAIIGILDLYNKEKENNKELKKANKKLQSDIEIKDKVINYIAKHTYIRTGENGVLGTITEEVIEHLYKKVEEENE